MLQVVMRFHEVALEILGDSLRDSGILQDSQRLRGDSWTFPDPF